MGRRWERIARVAAARGHGAALLLLVAGTQVHCSDDPEPKCGQVCRESNAGMGGTSDASGEGGDGNAREPSSGGARNQSSMGGEGGDTDPPEELA